MRVVIAVIMLVAPLSTVTRRVGVVIGIATVGASVAIVVALIMVVVLAVLIAAIVLLLLLSLLLLLLLLLMVVVIPALVIVVVALQTTMTRSRAKGARRVVRYSRYSRRGVDARHAAAH